MLDVDPGASVLDVGCGTGIALREIADLVGTNGTIVGLDPSTAMLEQTRARLAGVSARIHLIAGTATDTGLERDRFDAVRTERVLMHISQPREALAELARVTRPGGRIVVVEPDHRRLAVDTDVPDTWLGLVTAFSRLVPNISAGLRVLSDATALGLTAVAIEPMTHQFRSYLGDIVWQRHLDALPRVPPDPPPRATRRRRHRIPTGRQCRPERERGRPASRPDGTPVVSGAEHERTRTRRDRPSSALRVPVAPLSVAPDGHADDPSMRHGVTLREGGAAAVCGAPCTGPLASTFCKQHQAGVLGQCADR